MSDFHEQMDVGATMSIDYDLSEHPELAAAVGRVVAAFACVETRLCHVMAFLMQTPFYYVHPVFYSIVSNNARVSVLRALSDNMLGAEVFRSRLGALLDRVSAMANHRNEFAHGRWSIGTDSKYAYLSHNLGNPATAQAQRIRAEDVSQISQAIMQLSTDIGDFLGEYAAIYSIPLSAPAAIPEAYRKLFES